MKITIDDSKIINQEAHLNFAQRMQTDKIIMEYKRQFLNNEITKFEFEQLVDLRQKAILEEGNKLRDPE